MRIFLFSMLILFSVAAYGQSIFKCKQHDGGTAYQDHPCPGAKNDRPNMIIKPSSGDAFEPRFKDVSPAASTVDGCPGAFADGDSEG